MAFNKLFVMLPLMLAARNIDGEDPNTVYLLRVAYGAIQLCCALLVIYVYIQASAVAAKGIGGVIYVPPASVVRTHFVILLSNSACLVGHKVCGSSSRASR